MQHIFRTTVREISVSVSPKQWHKNNTAESSIHEIGLIIDQCKLSLLLTFQSSKTVTNVFLTEVLTLKMVYSLVVCVRCSKWHLILVHMHIESAAL